MVITNAKDAYYKAGTVVVLSGFPVGAAKSLEGLLITSRTCFIFTSVNT